MPSIGSASLAITPSFDGLQRDLDRGTSKAMAVSGKTAGGRFGSAFKTAAKVGLVAAAGLAAGAIKVGIDSVNLAADFEQSVGAVDAIFKGSSKKIHRWADSAADDVGLTANEFNELGTLIGAQLKNGGTAMDDLAPKTRDLITAGADMSAMFGGTTKEAVEALSSALKGERDPIERYGVSLTQAKIDAEAAELGFKKVDGALSNQATQAATLSIIMEQTADAHGKFADEADTLAGKQQRLHARIEDVKTEIGTALLPIMTDAADFLLEKGVPAFEKFSDWFAKDGIDKIKQFGGFLKDDVAPVLKKAAGFASDFAGALNDLPKTVKIGGLAGLAALVGGLKLRGGGGALGGVGKALGLAKPVPVFVTNKGFGTPGAVPGKTPGGFVATAGKFGMVGLLAGAAYAMYKMPDIWNFGAKKLGDALGLEPKKGGDDPSPGAAGSPEHKEILKGWQGAEGGVNKYTESLERARDRVTTMTNGVTGFSSKAERARDKVLGITNGFIGTQREADKARDKVGRLADSLDRLDGRVITTYFNPVKAKADIPYDQLHGRASGGHMRAGTPYLVGERGPEVFTPYAPGRMSANHQGGPAPSGGGGGGVNVYIENLGVRDFDEALRQIDRRRRERDALDGRRPS